MEHPTAIIQINDSKIKLIIGNVIDNKPVLIYSTERDISQIVERGQIKNFISLTEIIRSLANICDEEAKLRIKISDTIVILPPTGFKVYESEKFTNVTSDSNFIQKLDIDNLVSMVRKEPIDNDSLIVDIIPDAYYLNNGETYHIPPIGKVSSNLAMKAKVQTMPNSVVNTYQQPFISSGIRVRNFVIEPYAISSLIKTKKDYPNSYLLVSIEDGITSLTLVSNNAPIQSAYFELGLKDLVETVSSYFSISENEAYNYIRLYGINDRELNFEPIIIKSKNEIGKDLNYTPADLNNVIKTFMDRYLKQLGASYNALLNGYLVTVKKAPVVFSGEFTKINGVNKILRNFFNEANEKYFLCSDVVGARKSSYNAVIGALLTSSMYKGSLSDQRATVASVDRVKDSKKQK